jgi:hypothetical protein
MRLLIIKSLYLLLFIHTVSGMNNGQGSRDPLFRSTSSSCDDDNDNNDSLDLDTIPSISVPHARIHCIVRDSKRALRGLTESYETHPMKLTYLDNPRDKGELYRFKRVGNFGNKCEVVQIMPSHSSFDEGKTTASSCGDYEWGFVSADGKILVGINKRDIVITNQLTKKATRKTCDTGDIQAGMVSPDRQTIALSVATSFGGKLLVLRISGDTFFLSYKYSRALDFSHDSQRIAALSGVYDIKENRPIWEQEIKGNSNAWSCASFNGDSTLLAVGHRNGTTTVFNAHNGVRLYELWQGGEQAFFSQDNRYLATRGVSGVRIWKLSVLQKIYDTFSQEQRQRLNEKLDESDYGTYPPELAILSKIDSAMQNGSRVPNKGNVEDKFQSLPAPLQKAFRKHIADPK